MSTQLACPYCGAKLFPHEVSNDQCGTCGGRLSGAFEWDPPASNGEERPGGREEALVADRPFSSPLNRPPPEAFAAVRQGINLVRWGLCLSLGCDILIFLGVVAFISLGEVAVAIMTDNGQARVVQMLGVTWAVFQIGSLLLILLGVCFCCTVPRGCGARKWVSGVVPCLVAGVLLVLTLLAVGVNLDVPGGGGVLPSDWSLLLAFVAPILAFVALIGTCCYFLLLATLARFFGDGGLGKSLKAFCLVSLMASALGVVGAFFAFLAESGGYLPVCRCFLWDIVACGGQMLDVTLSVWLLILLHRLHGLIPVPGVSPPAPDRRS